MYLCMYVCMYVRTYGWMDGWTDGCLSLFDGTGLARVAIEEIIRYSLDITLVQSAFVENDEILSNRVEAVWRHHQASGHIRVPHRAIARDIWDLFRDERAPLGTNVDANEIKGKASPLCTGSLNPSQNSASL